MRKLLAVVATTTVVALAGCSGSDGSDGSDGGAEPRPTGSSSTTTSSAPAAPDAPAVGPQYVALGDSYSAAPGVPETSGADGCFRSSANYPQLLALDTGLTITDATCSGATTDTVLSDQVPQITAEAELVTVGIGGNDFDLYTRLIGSCLQLAASDPDGAPCDAASRAEAEQLLPQIADNIGGVLDAIGAAAPDARVVAVGYPDLLPASGSCPDRIGLATGDYGFVNEVTRALSAALRDQAAQRGYNYADVSGPSAGHDICSDDPWVNGAETAPDGTIPFHPFGVEQQAIAEIVAAFL